MNHLDLIQRSVSHNEIAHAEHSEYLAAHLLAECDDWVENGDITEYWGEHENGDEWRVHLHGAP